MLFVYIAMDIIYKYIYESYAFLFQHGKTVRLYCIGGVFLM
jgi:hypothetical protein